MRFMDRKFFHGALEPMDLAQPLVAEFNRGNMRAQLVGEGDRLAVQIGTRPGAPSGGTTAMTITIQKAPDGVVVQAGAQEWLGTAASIGKTTIAAIANPWNILGRLDDLAQDVENLQLTERVLGRAAASGSYARRKSRTLTAIKKGGVRLLRYRKSRR